MKVLLFGGTFDPPHNGHMNNLAAALALIHPDRAVVMPAGTPPHKAASATPAALRFQMCDCFKALSPVVQVSNWEIEQGGRSFTINTLEMLRDTYPSAELFLSVGSDMLLSFTEWRDWQKILHMATLIVESRENGDIAALQAKADELCQSAGAKILFAKAAPYPCASAQIRSGQIPHSMWARVLPENVLQIIEKYNLYNAKNEAAPPSVQYTSITEEQAKHIAKPLMGKKRWTHTKNVKKMAVQLAKRWGANEEKAAVAAILHDSAKELSKEQQLQIFTDNGIIAKDASARPVPVWHGIAASILAQTRWGVTDPEILSAILCHTTGKVNMGLLDKIIYLADMTSAERDWPGVEELRKLEMQDLDKALLQALKQSIDFVKEKDAPLDPESVAAYEYELNRQKTQGKTQ